MTVTHKKLIEVALPLDAINAACAREKSIRHGHPSTLHLWWARRPFLPLRCRANLGGKELDHPRRGRRRLRSRDESSGLSSLLPHRSGH